MIQSLTTNRQPFFVAIISVTILFSIGTKSSAQNQWTTQQTIAADIEVALGQLKFEQAARLAEKLVAADSTGKYRMVAADAMLRSGKPEQAIKWYDEHLKRKPDDKPYLWQLGIAYYFVGNYDQAAKQFQIHREVNPYDVENAAWHFLCVAKSKSPKQAKQMVLPAPNDPRPPMAEVLEMLKTGDTADVVKRMEQIPDRSHQKKPAVFYGNVYLGLYADALGDAETAKKHMDIAAKDAPRHYMGDVARVYAQYLRK